MKNFNLVKTLGRGLILGLAIYLMVTFSFDPTVSPVSADLVLPPRPEPVVVEPSVNGAMIKLAVTKPLTGNEWTVVQWQDPYTKDWHNADGWQGELDADGTQIWWVGRELFGKTAFRWQVYASENGSLLYTSSQFDMPTTNRQTVTVTISADSGN